MVWNYFLFMQGKKWILCAYMIHKDDMLVPLSCSGSPGSPGRRGMMGFRGPPGFVGRQGVKGKRQLSQHEADSCRLTPHFMTTTTSVHTVLHIPAADCVSIFDPQDRKEMRVRRETEDPRVLWDPKEREASKVRGKQFQLSGTFILLAQQLLTWFLLSWRWQRWARFGGPSRRPGS